LHIVLIAYNALFIFALLGAL